MSADLRKNAVPAAPKMASKLKLYHEKFPSHLEKLDLTD